jgi:hypothetical protein
MAKTLFNHLFLFLAYLCVCSLFLLNLSGGADIVFVFFFVGLWSIHLISLAVWCIKTYAQSNNQGSVYSLILILSLGVVFLFFLPEYLSFIWEIIGNQ